jgi:hypothetical protein
MTPQIRARAHEILQKARVDEVALPLKRRRGGEGDDEGDDEEEEKDEQVRGLWEPLQGDAC